MTILDEALGGIFARLALRNVAREFPRKVDYLLHAAPGDLAPRKIHPAFFGSFDWHSAVHMHWLLARVLGNLPRIREAATIRAELDRHLSKKALAAELAYLKSPAGRTFERPYGWAWLLELHAELLRHGMRNWSDALCPLASLLAARLGGFVARAPHPIRAGSHGNTAFACILALDYAAVAGDAILKKEICRAALRWYGGDRNAPLAYEPSLDDFLSPALVEAVLMKSVLPPRKFASWFAAFLPAGLGPLATPPVPADRADPKQSHLDGLALSRAWCLRRLGVRYEAVSRRHLAAALPHVAGRHYVGTHWLASFAALALGDSP